MEQNVLTLPREATIMIMEMITSLQDGLELLVGLHVWS
jgi:hypothetical protein